jgi:UPF0755 protein
MANEPTWDDLFGSDSDLPPHRSTPTSPEPPQNRAPAPTGAPLAAPAPAGAPQAAPQQSYVQTQQRDPFTQIVSPVEAPPTRSTPPASSRRSASGDKPPKKRRRLTGLWVFLAIVALGIGGVATVWTAFGPQVRHVMGWEGPVDYTGSGDGKAASITVLKGQYGSDIAKSLQKASVVKTASAFYSLLIKQSPQPNFEPGVYKLQEHMSSKAALAALQNPKNHVVSKIVIPEGATMEQFFTRLSAGTGVPVSDFEAAAKNYTALGVPANAPSLEGFLFPATYTFDPGTDAPTILKALVTRMYQSLDAAGVAPADRLRVLTLASIVQKEGGSTADFYKVARVFQNRLDQHMLLQSDATVSYGAHTSSINTTAAQRADASNLYNTYVHQGLPIGPIASPGDAAIKAALNPAPGTWLYFVLVNGSTGETVFSDTLAQHNVAVAQWQAWLKDHPGYDK